MHIDQAFGVHLPHNIAAHTNRPIVTALCLNAEQFSGLQVFSVVLRSSCSFNSFSYGRSNEFFFQQEQKISSRFFSFSPCCTKPKHLPLPGLNNFEKIKCSGSCTCSHAVLSSHLMNHINSTLCFKAELYGFLSFCLILSSVNMKV